MPIFDHFDLIAPLYDRVIHPAEPKTLLKILEIPSNGLILDAGGGTGRISQYITGRGSPVVVADLSMGMLRQAKDKTGLERLCSFTERLPFAADTFDRILMVDTLHHVDNQRQTIVELWRVLKPGGRVVVEEPDVRLFAVKLIALGEKMALMRSHFLSPLQIKGLFDFSNASSQILQEGHNSRVVVDKVH